MIRACLVSMALAALWYAAPGDGAAARAITPVALAVPQAFSVDFDTQIVPILTRSGCNAGACHGAAAGRGGFHLSLFGGDPAQDHDSIVNELEGRRVNPLKPIESLLIAKPSERIKHRGGYRIEKQSPAEELLAQWIAAGAPRAKSPPKLTFFEVTPAMRVVEEFKDGQASVPLVARAGFDGRPPRDVTAWTLFVSADPMAVEIEDEPARAIVRRRGQHILIARFMNRVVPIRLIAPFGQAAVDHSRQPRANFIDDHILDQLSMLRLDVSARAGDAAFFRRVHLDLIGRLPEKRALQSFLGDSALDKRAKLVDRLLASEEFVEFWTFKLANLLGNRPMPNDSQSAAAFHGWLAAELRQRRPLDQIARQMITALGDTRTVGPAYFTRLSGDARAQAERFSQAFMGVRMQCANCHNHPLDRWTQDDYHGLAAIFAKLERGPVVKLAPRGAVTNPRTSEPALPRLPALRMLDAEGDHRQALADWLTAPENSHFARSLANRLWQSMFGRGLVDPVDDLRSTNPGTHPELLDRLAADLVARGYDARRTLRLIALSETYNRSSTPTPTNRVDDLFYSHFPTRPLQTQVLADAWSDVTGVADRYGQEPPGTRAIALIHAAIPSVSLDILGRCSRQDSCQEDGTGDGGGLAGLLHRLNGPFLNERLASPDGRLGKLIRQGRSVDDILEEFYLTALGRKQDDAERAFWRSQASGVADGQRAAWLEDAIWALLNSREFTTNH